MQLRTPLVDVLIPVFNGEKFIASSILSILDQTLSDIHLHVVDDGSTDGTGKILVALAQKDSRIHVHTQENSGIVEALNNGLSFCTAPYIARHDADDLAFQFRLRRQVDLMDAQSDVVAVGGSARHIDVDGKHLGTIAQFPPPDHSDPFRLPAVEPYLLHPFLMIRREALVFAGGYRHVVHSEDTDLYWRLQEVGRLVSDSEVLGNYRLHADSISSLSVCNGRIMSVCSQLSALSAVRRRSGLEDIPFGKLMGERLKRSASSMISLCVEASKYLSQEEARHLRFSSSVKLLEMAAFRPYELELSDCIFARQSFLESNSTMDALDHQRVYRTYSGSAARLVARGEIGMARSLLFPGMARSFMFRLLVRVIMPPSIHRRIRRLFTGIVKRL